MNKIYVVEALRYGDREKHSYVVGVFDNIDDARISANAHELWRGGKYDCVITNVVLNEKSQEEIDFLNQNDL